MSDDERTGIFIDCTPAELAAWETAAALSHRALTVEEWARVLLNWRAGVEERRYMGESP